MLTRQLSKRTPPSSTARDLVDLSFTEQQLKEGRAGIDVRLSYVIERQLCGDNDQLLDIPLHLTH